MCSVRPAADFRSNREYMTHTSKMTTLRRTMSSSHRCGHPSQHRKEKITTSITVFQRQLSQGTGIKFHHSGGFGKSLGRLIKKEEGKKGCRKMLFWHTLGREYELKVFCTSDSINPAWP
ncbi:hypothetical protein HRR83_009456 [Exophiala dermatitidis]|uniref:Uncharacterized protein n=1 Tax=Exophiala dermatitidis TaxID=5970 RepID=A0AAN6EJH9_EXODE|nr:hypothetical protein HRR73_009503 [Exophiala dermatitidis]KAJ4502740.1 hypothetical protein HRR74_009497 [Exophiala dermatitidis]KAJ4531452.1 hypothetical protein HRR77_009487 [Exophiala dermatitidis]KAJ4534287.1 hypothetical protein HRR76_006216 [Exophiala dermatitidis]KAJ4563965.1 hypothetical protein HRR79_005993 [Exophiala dermatitidis]